MQTEKEDIKEQSEYYTTTLHVFLIIGTFITNIEGVCILLRYVYTA